MLLIQHATIHTPDRIIEDGAVLVDGDRLAAVDAASALLPPPDVVTLEAAGLILVPGFIDLQCNGAFGHDFTADPGSIWTVAAQLPRYGVTAFLPTIITAPTATVARAQEVIRHERPAGFLGAEPLGLHVEGPFLNPQKKGAHNPAYLRLPDLEAIATWRPEQGVRLVTLAPELPGGLDLVAALQDAAVVVSAGHSMATFAEAEVAFSAGIRYCTHLYNAMPALHHREPGLMGAALTDPRPTVGLIADGIHCHPAMVSLAWQMLGGERLNLVTDAMAALGMPPGRHLLGDFEVTVDGTSCRLADGTLAGSILSLDQAVRNLIAFTGCSPVEALTTVTTTPARLLGLESERGCIRPGMVADLVLLTPDLQVVATVTRGRVAHKDDQ